MLGFAPIRESTDDRVFNHIRHAPVLESGDAPKRVGQVRRDACGYLGADHDAATHKLVSNVSGSRANTV